MATNTPAVVYPVNTSSATITGSDFAVSPWLNGSQTANVGYSGTFIPTVWSAKLNAKFYAASTFAAITNTDWQGDISNMGDKVVINTAPDISITDYTIGTELTYQAPEPVAVELQIDKGKVFAFAVSDVFAYQSKISMMETFSADAGEQMKVAIDADCLNAMADEMEDIVRGGTATGYKNGGATAGAKSGAFNLGTYLVPVQLTGANVLQKILEMASVLDEANVPESDRWLVIDPLTRTLLLQSNLSMVQFTGDPSSPVRNGMIGRIDRFTVYVSNQTPRTTAAAKDFFGGTLSSAVVRRAILAGHKSAMAFASQMTKTETLRNPKDFGDLVRGLQVYGRKLVKPDAMCILEAV